jgi:hypothetical protein
MASAAAIGVAVPAASAEPAAAAEPCPDVEVIFARGTTEPPGVGGTGQAFVDALRAQAGGKTVGVYPVNYPASSNFGDRIAFARTVVDGIKDAGARIQTTAAACPDTRIVLGGYSQGAVLAGFVTADTIPDGIPDEYLSYMPNPVPDELAEHVAAVVLMGKPSSQWLRQYDAPLVTIGPLYEEKTLDLCAPGDTICDGAPGGIPTFAHTLYPVNGMVNEAAAFAAGRL